MRERWFGATGRRVPEIVVEGEHELPLEDALVLEGVDEPAQLEQAHAQGIPVVVRAEGAEAVQAALRRPEVASVIVPASKRELRDLDFRRLTYG